MFRAQMNGNKDEPILKLEGKLVANWADAATSLVTRETAPNNLVVDLSELSYIDSVGEEVLHWFSSIGAKFIANNVYAAAVCERLRLPLKAEL